jgi:hypothetical protein
MSDRISPNNCAAAATTTTAIRVNCTVVPRHREQRGSDCVIEHRDTVV